MTKHYIRIMGAVIVVLFSLDAVRRPGHRRMPVKVPLLHPRRSHNHLPRYGHQYNNLRHHLRSWFQPERS